MLRMMLRFVQSFFDFWADLFRSCSFMKIVVFLVTGAQNVCAFLVILIC